MLGCKMVKYYYHNITIIIMILHGFLSYLSKETSDKEDFLKGYGQNYVIIYLSPHKTTHISPISYFCLK